LFVLEQKENRLKRMPVSFIDFHYKEIAVNQQYKAGLLLHAFHSMFFGFS
jgi:hypothetical protein